MDLKGLILFDIDGVIRDVSSSYRLAIQETVKKFCSWKPTFKQIDDLKAEYAFGSSVVREALSLLTSDNLVERVEQRGFFVSNVSLNEYEEILNMRCLLEEQAIRDSVSSGTLLWEEQVITANYRLSRISRSLDKNRFTSNPAWESAHKNFHMTLISACRSSLLIKFCKQFILLNLFNKCGKFTTLKPKKSL